MATLDRRYYYLPKRLVHVTVGLVLATVVLGGGALWALTPRWLPAVARALDVDVPIDNPDAAVIGAGTPNGEIERRVARLYAQHQVGAIALYGSPFTSDVLVPQRSSARVGALVGFGVPRSAIVEAYDFEGNTNYEALAVLRDEAVRRGWRRLLFVNGSPGTRGAYLAARQILGTAGIQVGEVTVPTPQFDAENWWHDNRERGRVVFAWLGLLLGWATGHY
jgi:hypothetical protein